MTGNEPHRGAGSERGTNGDLAEGSHSQLLRIGAASRIGHGRDGRRVVTEDRATAISERRVDEEGLDSARAERAERGTRPLHRAVTARASLGELLQELRRVRGNE